VVVFIFVALVRYDERKGFPMTTQRVFPADHNRPKKLSDELSIYDPSQYGALYVAYHYANKDDVEKTINGMPRCLTHGGEWVSFYILGLSIAKPDIEVAEFHQDLLEAMAMFTSKRPRRSHEFLHDGIIRYQNRFKSADWLLTPYEMLAGVVDSLRTHPSFPGLCRSIFLHSDQADWTGVDITTHRDTFNRYLVDNQDVAALVFAKISGPRLAWAIKYFPSELLEEHLTTTTKKAARLEHDLGL
jgi:hypothetical protein